MTTDIYASYVRDIEQRFPWVVKVSVSFKSAKTIASVGFIGVDIHGAHPGFTIDLSLLHTYRAVNQLPASLKASNSPVCLYAEELSLLDQLGDLNYKDLPKNLAQLPTIHLLLTSLSIPDNQLRQFIRGLESEHSLSLILEATQEYLDDLGYVGNAAEHQKQLMNSPNSTWMGILGCLILLQREKAMDDAVLAGVSKEIVHELANAP